MKPLPDTHDLIWATADPDRLGPPARQAITEPDNDLSAARKDPGDFVRSPPWTRRSRLLYAPCFTTP